MPRARRQPYATPLTEDRPHQKRRIALGITQQELAERIGCSVQLVKRYERGDEVSPMAATAFACILGRCEHATNEPWWPR